MNNKNIICKATNQPCSDCTYSCESKAEWAGTNKELIDYIIGKLNKRNDECAFYIDRLDFIKSDIEFILEKVDEYHNKKGIN